MSLRVLVDGVPLADTEAKALWTRFSDWMEEHRGDLAGFAMKEGFASVHPGVDAGGPVLLASRSAPQMPYAPVAQPKGDIGGSGDRHVLAGADRSRSRKGRKRPRT